MNVLHVAAEAHPLIKTGGLADVVGALPAAQRRLGLDARLLIPGYPSVLAGLAEAGPLTRVASGLGPHLGAARIDLLAGRMPGNGLPVIAIDAPWLYDRPGNPYVDAQGAAWADSARRFALLGWLAARIAVERLIPDWSPAVIHAHDWHAALAPLYLGQRPQRRVRTVFTVHNLAYQGLFPLDLAPALEVDAALLTSEGVEYFGELSFMKAGLALADRITTVSPAYAREITTPAQGQGLDGLIRSRGGHLVGILNGIDADVWDPEDDAALAAPYAQYGVGRPAGKKRSRRALQEELGLAAGDQGEGLLIAVVSRLTEQKGLDLLLAGLPTTLSDGVQWVILGSGDPALEQGFAGLARAHPTRIAFSSAFDEALAHRIFAGADAILVPSRFEPCGLTQMYGLRYGTVPIVRQVGGLADTVFEHDAPGRPANGFVFEAATTEALLAAVARARASLGTARWRTLMRTGMSGDYSWAAPAARYRGLYDELVTLDDRD